VESAHAEHFHRFLRLSNTWLPATFAENHSGASSTFTSRAGQGFRIDYIALPLAWQRAEVKSRVLTDVDLLCQGDDHHPVCVDLTAAVTPRVPTKGAVPARRPPADATPQECEAFRHILRQAPAVPWCHGVNHRCEQVRHAYDTAFAPRPRAGTSTFLQADTLDSVRQRSALLRLAHEADALLARQVKTTVFMAWRLGCHGGCLDAPLLASRQRLCHQARAGRAALLMERRRLALRVRRAVKVDRATYLESLQQGLAAAAGAGNMGNVYRQLRRAFPGLKGSPLLVRSTSPPKKEESLWLRRLCSPWPVVSGTRNLWPTEIGQPSPCPLCWNWRSSYALPLRAKPQGLMGCAGNCSP
jgi:hypothetical protein